MTFNARNGLSLGLSRCRGLRWRPFMGSAFRRVLRKWSRGTFREGRHGAPQRDLSRRILRCGAPAICSIY